MKPAWDEVMRIYENHDKIRIAGVDCTSSGQELCQRFKVAGYPTIKYGDPDDMQDYKGGRSLQDLLKFVEGMRPSCSAYNLEPCTPEQLKDIEKYRAMSSESREKSIKEEEEKLAQLETDLTAFTEVLQGRYSKAKDEHDAQIEQLKGSGLTLLKAVEAYERKRDSKKAEL
eukprot:TRINITY_DN1271_c0_g1_i1.p1 TRINITY_DN1271_c0_g1~~TRINITY_DN1271_c0_g1_i1.p1  ORF type:complete len:171 (+),score=55.12 TRINITY_DN1271_c0_g1_i1:384-896(+)